MFLHLGGDTVVNLSDVIAIFDLDVTSTSKTTIINKTDVDAKFTDNIKELLGVGIVSTSSVSSSNVDITIILGNDYKQ